MNILTQMCTFSNLLVCLRLIWPHNKCGHYRLNHIMQSKIYKGGFVYIFSRFLILIITSIEIYLFIQPESMAQSRNVNQQSAPKYLSTLHYLYNCKTWFKVR